MDNKQPLVSVLMTCYNREDYIVDAVESVLYSSFQDFELIISDDGSTDRTVEIIRGYESRDPRVKVFVNEKNLGDYFNRNKAASYAKGKYLKYLDSDDIFYKHGLGLFVESMEKYPDAAFGLSSFYDPTTPYPVMISPKEIYLEHFSGFTHFHRAPGSAIIRRDIFEFIGGFSGKRGIGDTELWLKLATNYNMVKIHADLYWARQHAQTESNLYRQQMFAQGNKLLVDFLQSKNCPLNTSEKKAILKKLKKRRIKSVLQNMFIRN